MLAVFEFRSMLSHIFSKNMTLILCVVLFGCETWSHTLRKELRLRVFENGAEGNIWM